MSSAESFSVHFTVFECDFWIKDASYYKIKTLCGITVIGYGFLKQRLEGKNAVFQCGLRHRLF
jgi:hypothetical protein